MEKQNDYPKITFDRLNFTYETKVGDMEIEFEGHLYPYNDGKCDTFRVVDDSFSDNDSRDYFDNNWEDIEEEILSAYSKSVVE